MKPFSTDSRVPVAVIAGTPVDTAMGCSFLEKYGCFLPKPYFVSPSPEETTHIQLLPQAQQKAFFTRMFAQAEAEGCRDFFIYCNSLSAAFDFVSLAAERGVRLYTPLLIYRTWAERCSRLAVIAANNQSTAGIEKVLYEGNPHISVQGLGDLALVEAVESGLPPAQLVEKHHLAALCRYFADCGAEALILGCTHFPYFKEALRAVTQLPLLDPAEAMAAQLLHNTGAEKECRHA